MTSFGARLAAALDTYGPLCVGIDPHAALLSDWGLDATATGVREFGLRVVDAAAGAVGVVKPQVAFFERFGSAGFAALEDVQRAAREAGLLVIADAKRGDIGSTMEGYAAAWLAVGAPLEADAVTVSPYLGPDSLRGTLTTAVRAGKGVFVLAATSNPEAFPLQSAQTVDVAAGEGETVAQRVARDVTWANKNRSLSALRYTPPMAAHSGTNERSDATKRGDPRLGPVGLVIGATVDRAAVGLDDVTLRGAPILAPGFGAQGAEPADLVRIFGALTPNIVANESRSVLSAGADGIRARIVERAGLYRGLVEEYRHG